MSFNLKRFCVVFPAILVGLFFSISARAATIPVNDSTCTLSDAIIAANTNAVVAKSGCPKGDPDTTATDVIELSSGMIIMMSGYYASAGEAFPLITSKLIINGNGATVARDTSITCDDYGDCTGAPSYRIFHVKAPGNLTINSLTVSGGVGNGGGVYNEGGTVLLNGCTISGNSSSYGGGVYNDYGTLTIQKSVISNNSGQWGGGGVYSSGNLLTITDSTLSYNDAGAAWASGGGVRINGGDTKISRTAIIHNTSSDGGGISITSGTATIDNSTIAQNGSSHGGAAVYMSGTNAVTFTYDTITANMGGVGLGGGGIYTDFGAPAGGVSPLSIRNTYLAGNISVNSPDCSAYLTSLGGNILSTYVTQVGYGCKVTTLSSDNLFDPALPVLGPDLLTLNTPGATYYPLTISSQAIGKALVCAGCPTVDQLNLSRDLIKPTVGAIEGKLPVSTCNDGIIGLAEICDTKGPLLNGKTCLNLGAGYDGGNLGCAAGCKAYDVSGCTSCGDGVKNAATELCDTKDLGGKTCATLGKAYDGGVLGCKSDCTFDEKQCTIPAVCGDKVISPGEDCEGFDLGGKDCTTIPGGFVGGQLKCAANCKFDTSACVAPPPGKCGDGKKNGTEACDGQDLGGVSCASLGFASGTLSCTDACAFDTSKCAVKVITSCGDGHVNGIEACDGSDFGKKTCENLNLGYVGGVLHCTDQCTLDLMGCTTANNGGVPAVIETPAKAGATETPPASGGTTTPALDLSPSTGATAGTSTGCSLIR